jgi:hypothetical protein
VDYGRAIDRLKAGDWAAFGAEVDARLAYRLHRCIRSSSRLDGLKLQSLTEVDLESVVFALTYSGDRSVAIFAWRDKADGPAQTFVNSFASLPDRDKATAAGLLAFVNIENTHLQPRWWEGLAVAAQIAIGRLIGAAVRCLVVARREFP